MNEIEAFIRDAAIKRGIDPDIAVKVAMSEGGVTEPARLGDFSGAPWYSGKSWWPFQLHYGGAGTPWEAWGHSAGMGNGFTELTGHQPGDPRAWRDSVRFALNRAKASGWGAWYGAAHVGVDRWEGINRLHPWDAAAEPWDYETGGGSVPGVTYDRTFPATIQDDDWSCAPSSLDWALRSLGRTPGHSYIERLLVEDGIVSHEQGLLVATGGPLAAWIGKSGAAYYGEDGFYGNNEGLVTFEGLAAEIGPYPMLIGGRNWGGPGYGHWSGLRSYDPGRNVLVLANPAGSGPTFGGQEMTRAQFAQRGPFSMVRVLHPDLLETAPEPVPVDRAAELVAEINTRVNELAGMARR